MANTELPSDNGPQQVEVQSHFPSPQLLRIGDIAATYYASNDEGPSQTLIIYGIGAPRTPDFGDLPDANIIRSHGVDIVVPDYIGFGRSDGEFTPGGCVETFTRLYGELTEGTEGVSTYDHVRKPMQYKRIIVVGRSLGGTFVPLLPGFDPRIRELAILCPVVDSKSQGSVEGEEGNELFMASMERDGYHHLYRGITTRHRHDWEQNLESADGLSPMDNIHMLDGVRLFIGHGTNDTVVHYSKSQRYHEELLRRFPLQGDNFKLMIVPGGGHGATTTNPAMEAFLKWLGL